MENKERTAGLSILICSQAIVIQLRHLLGSTAKMGSRVSDSVGKCRPDKATLNWIESSMVPAHQPRAPSRPRTASSSSKASAAMDLDQVPIAAPIAVEPENHSLHSRFF